MGEDGLSAVVLENGLKSFSGVKQTFMLCADADDFYG